jgi:hypothetical protein
MEQLEHHPSTLGPVLQTAHGRLVRCCHCGGMHFQFGNLSTRLDADSFLRLLHMVHQAATSMAPGLMPEERVAIPMAQGAVSLVLDREEFEELYGLVSAGRQWVVDGTDAGEVLH